PEAGVVLGSGRAQEVVDLDQLVSLSHEPRASVNATYLLVDLLSTSQILGATNLGLNQVVTVDGGGSLDTVNSSRHELENCHLGSGVLASNAVRAELEVGLSTLDVLVVGIIKMGVENLLSQSQRLVEPCTDNLKVLT